MVVIAVIGRRGGAMNGATENKGPLSIEEVLAAEADAISHGATQMAASLASGLKGQKQHNERTRLNADDRDRSKVDKGEVDNRKSFYRSLNELNRGAICCSGGGIRSATFCLGIVQALAGYDVKARQWPTEVEPPNSLLGHFHYLSTVSGGGYFGSWLSSWRAREGFATLIANLTGRPRGPDVEPPEISWLRAYSNYLTPQLGIASADTWAAVAISGRNLILNWLIIIPVVCLVLLTLKIIATVSVWAAHRGYDDLLVRNDDHRVIYVLLFGVACLVGAQAFTTRHRPPRRPPPPPDGHQPTAAGGQKDRLPAAGAEKALPKEPGNATQAYFVWGDFIWAVVSATAVTIFFSSYYFWHELTNEWPKLWHGLPAQWPRLAFVTSLGINRQIGLILVTACASLAIYAAGWICGWRWRKGWLVDFLFWTLSGLVYGALVGFGAALYVWLVPYPANQKNIECLLLPIIFGVPWVLTAQLLADNIFGGLVSYEASSDADREWLGRAAGWLAAIAIAWALVAFLVFAGDYFVLRLVALNHQIIVAAGGVFAIISGIVTAFIGKSSFTPAKLSSDNQDNLLAFGCNIAMAVAGPIFAAALIIGLSIGLDKSLFGGQLITQLQNFKDDDSIWPVLGPLLVGSGITLAIAWIASYYVNINRFSLHAIYRNRLVRAYLGASRQVRRPDLFTGFDAKDNIRVHELWTKKPAENIHRLFHVINIALNVVSTKRLAWQERKAESFTVSPLHCGSAYLGFRSSEEYGDGPKTEQAEHEAREGHRKFGIALGTAMAISGAAVSPNMGYNSSPSITLLLALFNVRLGWWLGNPGEAGKLSFKKEGPLLAAKPLFDEAFGQTTDQSRYVYLSDGGHFEDLGLYEMVRRRCRFIVVIDAGEDAKFAFEDLGNAVRKIYIDLGIRVTFESLRDLHNRPTSDDGPPEKIQYYALGTIYYKEADGAECEDGDILYIKPAYHGTETSAGIRSYAMAHEDFPHETTVDQWFTESQFESYRSLGLDIAHSALDKSREDVQKVLDRFLGPHGK
jgi:hypothetical protein